MSEATAAPAAAATAAAATAAPTPAMVRLQILIILLRTLIHVLTNGPGANAVFINPEVPPS